MTTRRSLLPGPGTEGSSVRAAAARRAPRTEAERSRWLLLAVCLAVAAVRLIHASQPLRSDEGGYLFVARHWAAAGEFLYGAHHVDRPPLLLAFYRLAALWEWEGAVRIVVIPFVLAAVLGLARAGFLAAGWRGARWSGVVAGALLTSPALASDQADGELFAAPFVAWSFALALQAWRSRPAAAQIGYAWAAGAVAGCAFLVKQNFLEGVVFVGALVLAEGVRRRRVTEPCRSLAVGFAGGLLALVVLATALMYAADLGLRQVWTQVLFFRGQALTVVWDGRMSQPFARATGLVLLSIVSMVLPIVWTWARGLMGRGRPTPVASALTATLAYGVVAMVAGGSYWVHYLLQLAPAVALAAGLVAAGDEPLGRPMRRLASLAVASALVANTLTTYVYVTESHVWWQQRTGEWLAASARPGDTAFVAYGHASVLEYADLDTPYPYLWSLPMRTLDPDQQRLRVLVAGPRAPSWIVQVNGLDSWGIDRGDRLRRLVRDRYRRVAEVCGHTVWLRADLSRAAAPYPRC